MHERDRPNEIRRALDENKRRWTALALEAEEETIVVCVYECACVSVKDSLLIEAKWKPLVKRINSGQVGVREGQSSETSRRNRTTAPRRSEALR